MSLIVTTKGGDFEQPAIGVINAVCSNVYDMGMHETEYQGQKKTVHQIVILWEINQTMTKGEYAGKRFVMSKWYTANLMSKSNLHKDLVAWRGVEFTEEEAKAFDLEKIIGANCLLQIGETKNGRPKIINIMKLPKDRYEKMVPELSRDHKPQWVYDAQLKGGIVDNPFIETSQSNITIDDPDDKIPF